MWCTRMDRLLCCFGCLTLCGCRDTVCRELVFFPPPPSYVVKEDELWTVDAEGVPLVREEDPRVEVHAVDTRYNNTLCALWLRQPHATHTMLFSHGNAADIGEMRAHLLDLGHQLGVDVVAYDYSGYGCSSGKPSVRNVKRDALAAMHYVLSNGVQESKVLVYGQSLGSAAALAIAQEYPRVAGVVLHAAFTSGLRVIRPLHYTPWFDIFPNIDVVGTIQRPVLIVHGTRDEEVPVEHGRALYEASNKLAEPLFIEGAGHNNIEMDFRSRWIRHLAAFLASV